MNAGEVIDALHRFVFANFMLGGSGRLLNKRVGDVVVENLGRITDAKAGPFDPLPWVCINVETGEIGRAYDSPTGIKIRTVDVDWNAIQEVMHGGNDGGFN